MASIQASITKTLNIFLNTNKGKFYFNVHYINTEVVENTSYYIQYTIGGDTWYPFVTPVSTYGGDVMTEFESVNGNVKIQLKSNKYYGIIANSGGDILYTTSLELSNQNTHVFTWTIIIGSNDVPFMAFTPFSTATISKATTYVPNSENQFGVYSRTDFVGVLSTTATLQYINFARALLDDSNLYEMDPYLNGGTTDGSGGKDGGSGSGTFDNTSDDINIPDLPTYSAVDTGFITIFNPSISQLKNLANYMWSNDLFNLDTWKKIFDNPMDAILGLSIVPVAVPEGGASDVTVGNIITTVSMTKASSQYVKVDCGGVNVAEYWGGYMDYAPYTKAELYLPYCGTHPINIDDIMGKTVQVVYHVDILSGACVAYVKCGTSVLYSFVGQCSSSIPITAGDMTSVINGILSISASVGTMVATGGMSAPITALVGTQLATSTASNVMNMKPHVEKSGSMSGTGGMLGIQTPYLIITRPRQCLPANQNTYNGYPSYITSQLSSLSGFTTVDSVHLSNMSCTDEEKSEIENILMQGVIL